MNVAINLLPLDEQELDWMKQSACRGVSPDVFFPADENRGNKVYAKAKTICKHCSVSWECLEYAVENGIKEGLWGGRTPGERRGMLKKDGQMSDEARKVLEYSEEVVESYRQAGEANYMHLAAAELKVEKLSLVRRLIRLNNVREKEARNGQ